MRELSVEEISLISGGGEAYDAGHAVGEMFGKSLQIAVFMAGIYFMMNT